MKLIDRLKIFETTHDNMFGVDFDDCIVIDGTAVAKVIDQETITVEGDEIVSMPALSYGIVAPPFKNMFVQAKTHYNQLPVERGVLMYSMKNPDINQADDVDAVDFLHHDVIMTESRFVDVREYHFA